ncbi:MAG: hypothetical protein K2N32_02250 [Clostridia bacterium]|nr:hypothetical protein [Clostridia bacterium]
MQAVYRPVKAFYISNNKYLFHNFNRFLSTDYLEVKWQFLYNGEISGEGIVNLDIPPMCDGEAMIKHPPIDTARECCINFIYVDKRTGKFVAREQIMLSKFIKKPPRPEGKEIVSVEENNHLKIFTQRAKIIFDLRTGKMSSYKIGEKEFICTDKQAEIFAPKIYRAPIDNYMYKAAKWRRQGLDKLTPALLSFDYEKNNNCLSIKTVESLSANGKDMFKVILDYNVFDNGEIDVTATLQKNKEYDIPKFGLNIELPKQFENITYYGMGEKESYSDMREHAIMGIYSMKIEDMYEHYIKPQDNGNRTDVRWVKITDENGEGLKIAGYAMSFDFNANRYSDKTLEETAHDFDLKESDKNIIRIDGFVRGIGSNSCGPDTRAEFKHTSKAEIRYAFRVKPLSSADNGKSEK